MHLLILHFGALCPGLKAVTLTDDHRSQGVTDIPSASVDLELFSLHSPDRLRGFTRQILPHEPSASLPDFDESHRCPSKSRTFLLHLPVYFGLPKRTPTQYSIISSPEMHFGTYTYGLSTGWGGCGSVMVRKTCQCSTCHSCRAGISGDHLTVPGFSVSFIEQKDCHNSKECYNYVIAVPAETAVSRAVSKKIVVRRDLAQRLYWRYLQHLKTHNRFVCSESSLSLNTTSRNNVDGNNECLPEYKNFSFLQIMCETMCRKYSSRFNSDARTVSPFLYSLWALTSSITVELFADSLNESGVLPTYCSLDDGDQKLGSIGTWEDVEDSVEGAGGNPPFERCFLQNMVTVFDSGVRGTAPYCRCVLLPLGESHGIVQRTTGLSEQSFTIPE